jgi:hypothetical protein
MKKRIVTSLLVLGALSLVVPAFAELVGSEDAPAMLMNARIAQDMASRAARPRTSTHSQDSVWVGYNPAYAGSNYWSIGVGHRRPRGTFGPSKADIPPVPDDDTGYWDWEHPVHGDSLQGWWPMRNSYSSFFIANLNDKLRPWHAIDIGNTVSYVINQGPGHRRTFGVSSAWHEDPGVNAKVPDPDPGKSDVNPNPPRWTPIAGSMSAWCGLRAHGDVTQVDPLTGNPYNADALGNEVWQGSATSPPCLRRAVRAVVARASGPLRSLALRPLAAASGEARALREGARRHEAFDARFAHFAAVGRQEHHSWQPGDAVFPAPGLRLG